jgi:hypothetical protein
MENIQPVGTFCYNHKLEEEDFDIGFWCAAWILSKYRLCFVPLSSILVLYMPWQTDFNHNLFMLYPSTYQLVRHCNSTMSHDI